MVLKEQAEFPVGARICRPRDPVGKGACASVHVGAQDPYVALFLHCDQTRKSLWVTQRHHQNKTNMSPSNRIRYDKRLPLVPSRKVRKKRQPYRLYCNGMDILERNWVDGSARESDTTARRIRVEVKGMTLIVHMFQGHTRSVKVVKEIFAEYYRLPYLCPEVLACS